MILTEIEASAYVPRSSHILSFWQDPADDLSKLYYVNVATAQATPVGQDLGEGRVTAAVAAMAIPSALAKGPRDVTPVAEVMQYELYAVQETEPIDFDIVNGQVVVNEPVRGESERRRSRHIVWPLLRSAGLREVKGRWRNH